MAGLFADENVPLPVVEALRQKGHTVVTAEESGRANQSIPDHEVLDYARSQGFALLTHNRRHFIRLHAEAPLHAGIVVCSFDPDFVGQGDRIHTLLEAQAELKGKLIRVNRPAR
ncbi:MAG: DUF5615 family PIN-like protein [Tepidisphaeraceae bacterium]